MAAEAETDPPGGNAESKLKLTDCSPWFDWGDPIALGAMIVVPLSNPDLWRAG